jgi:hypothetical protein
MGFLEYVQGHAFFVCRSSGRMVVYIYYITAAGKIIPTARSWAAPVRITGTVRKRQAVRLVLTYKITPAGSLSSIQAGGRRDGPAL